MRYMVVPRPRIRVRRSFFGNTCGSVLRITIPRITIVIGFFDDYVPAQEAR